MIQFSRLIAGIYNSSYRIKIRSLNILNTVFCDHFHFNLQDRVLRVGPIFKHLSEVLYVRFTFQCFFNVVVMDQLVGKFS